MRRIAGICVLILAITSGVDAAVSASGAPPCGDRNAIANALEQVHSEILTGYGLREMGFVIEVYVSPTTGSWTLVETRPTGVACILAAGDNWEYRLEPSKPKGAH